MKSGVRAVVIGFLPAVVVATTLFCTPATAQDLRYGLATGKSF